MTDPDGVPIFQTPGEVNCLKGELERIAPLSGDLIEIGVYMGGSAKVIAGRFPDRTLYLFDTFAGFPPDIRVADGDCEAYRPGDMKEASLEKVKQTLKEVPNARLFPGRFPDTAAPVRDKRFVFAHLDVDIYLATKEALEFLYPRMVPGGTILVHDYPVHHGVRKAVDEFMKDKPDTRRVVGVEGRQLAIEKQ